MTPGKLRRKWKMTITALLASAFFACLLLPQTVLADGGVLSGSKWQYLFTADSQNGGLIQSICLTKDYLITIENVADSADTPDVVSAYYRNDVDAAGNPVERFSLANRVCAEEWEHGNGMTYNPNTNEIYVSLYTNTIPENRGCIYVMDPDTLMKKGTIKITDEFNLLAIEYDQENDRYYIQANADYGFRILILDSQFQIVENLGTEAADPGYNFQDFCLAGDFLLQFPLTWGLNIGEFMSVYYIPDRAPADIIQLSFNELPNEAYVEPESIARLDDTGFIVAVNATGHDNYRRCLFYRVEFPNLPIVKANETVETVSQGETAEENAQTGDTSEQNVLTGNTSEQVEQSKETVQNTSETSVSVKKGNKTLTKPEKEKKERHVPKVLIVLLVIALLAAAMYLYLQHVRRVRARKEARMRKARRIMLARLAMEEEESEETGYRGWNREDYEHNTYQEDDGVDL